LLALIHTESFNDHVPGLPEIAGVPEGHPRNQGNLLRPLEWYCTIQMPN